MKQKYTLPHEGDADGFAHLYVADATVKDEWMEWMERLENVLKELEDLRQHTPYGFARYGGKLAKGFDTYRTDGYEDAEEFDSPIRVVSTFIEQCNNDKYVWA